MDDGHDCRRWALGGGKERVEIEGRWAKEVGE
jgi:hypothetical protein